MYWQATEEADRPRALQSKIIDVRYRIRCDALPVDHARELRAALLAVCPWLAEEPAAGVHSIHGAESGNGWIRPDSPTARLPLSRRTRLVLRLPREYLPRAQELCGNTLQVGPDPLAVEDLRVYPLNPQLTLFARYVAGPADDEAAFLAQCAEQLAELAIEVPRMLAGRMHPVATDSGVLHCRSLLLDGLGPEASLRLQESGLGASRLLGCGLFLPHKSIAPVTAAPRDTDTPQA